MDEPPHFSLYERKGVLATTAKLVSPWPLIANATDIRPRAASALLPKIFFPVSQADICAYFPPCGRGCGYTRNIIAELRAHLGNTH